MRQSYHQLILGQVVAPEVPKVVLEAGTPV